MKIIRLTIKQKVNFNQLFLLIFFTLIIQAGCAFDVGISPPSKLNFAHLEPINLQIGKIQIKNNLQQNMNGNQEIQLVSSLMASIENWAANRLKPVGGKTADRLMLSINNLSAIKTNLILDKSFSGLFLAQQSHGYAFKISVSLEVLGQTGEQKAISEIVITKKTTTPEGLTVNERERLLLKVQKKIMLEFDQALVLNISKYFFNWLEK